MSTPVFPTRHGDWHLIGGELVDLSQADTHDPEAAEDKDATGNDADGGESLPASLPPASPPPGKRRNPTSED